MSPRFPLAILLNLLAALPLVASIVVEPALPATPVRYGAAGNVSSPLTAASGDLVLAIWNRGEGAVRLAADGKPLDVPAIRLPRPEWTSGADVISDGDGWIVGWTIFDLGGSGSFLRLTRVGREGTVGETTDLVLTVRVDQNLPLHLAKSGESVIAAYSVTGEAGTASTAVVAVTGGDVVHSTVVSGELRALGTDSGGIALALGDRVVRLRSDLTQLSSTALPTGFRASDVARLDAELVVAGTTNTGPAVVSIREAAPAVVVTQMSGTAREVRMAVRDGEVLMVWNAAKDTGSYGSSSWDLYAARLHAGGTAEDPLLLRRDVDYSGRFILGPDTPEVEAAGDSWLVVWSDGFASTSGNLKNLFAAPLDEALGEPQLASWRALDQWLIGTAVSNDIVFVVWSEQETASVESRRTLAARFDLHGRLLSEVMNLGSFDPTALRATRDGAVVLGRGVQVRLGLEGAPVFDPAPAAPVHDIACAREECLAAWIDETSPSGPWSIRVSRWDAGELLDPMGVPVHFSAQPYGALSLATDGSGFLAAFAREAQPAGTILATASIARRDGEWVIHSADFAASEAPAHDPVPVWQGDRYLALWRSGFGAGEVRGSLLTSEGDSMDGDETGWRGWALTAAPPLTWVSDLASVQGRTLVLSERSLEEIEGRVARERLPVDGLSRLACGATACLLVSTQTVDGDPWFHATRLFVRPLSFRRDRAVRH